MKSKHIYVSLLISALVLFLSLFYNIVLAVDGSGTNTVSPTTEIVSSAGNTHAFTFTASETMDSGGITITAPSGFSAPQGVAGTAGYTTVSTSGIVANVLNNLDTATNWAVTNHMTLSADTGDKQEGTASLSNDITTQAQANEQWYFNYGAASNWGAANSTNGSRIGFWLKSSVNTASGNFSWQSDNTANLASPSDTLAIPALTANTWTYSSVTLGAARTAQLSYGFRYTTDIGAAIFKADSISAIFDAADVTTNWAGSSNVTVSALNTSGNFKEGTAARRCSFASGAVVGSKCYRTSNAGGAFTIGPGTTVSFWVRSSVALNAGDFQWMDDGSATLGSPEDTVNLPAIAANTWTYITLTSANSANKSVRSYGFNQAVDKGVMTLDIDAIGKQLNTLDSTTSWTTSSGGVQALTTDTSVFHEGTGSLKNIILSTASADDKWYQTLSSTQNWSGYTTVGFWIRSSVTVTAGQLKFEYSSASDLTSPAASIDIGALSANTWTYQKLTLTGTRSSINSYGINYATDIGAATIYLDDVLVGPGSVTFPGGGVIDVRLLDLTTPQTVVVTYGSGGGTSGVTAPSTAGTYNFITQSRASDSGSLTSIVTQPTITVNNDVPTTTSISPTSKTVGESTFTMTVNGTNFISSSVVNFAGSARTTTYVSPTQVTVSIPASDLLTAGTYSITVFNPLPGGGTSNAQTFTVNNPAPTTTSISPSTKQAGDPGFTITVNGTNFISGDSTVTFNGVSRTTTYVSSTQLTAAILASDIASVGSYNVRVVTATPGGGTSNAQVFSVTPADNPVPTTTSISPTSKTVGESTFTMTVNGTNFISSSVVNFAGSARTTTYVSPTQVTVSIPASDLLTAGTYSITVFNPLPGGGTSNAQTFTVVLPPDTTAPADISNLTISNPTTNSVDLSWMAPGDDNNTGTAASYDLRYSLSLITSANFGAATQVTGLPSPSAAGVGENFTVTGLSPNTLYYFAIKASDEVPNISGISNVPSTTTVATADTTAPSAVSDLAASSPTTSTITLTWLSPGNDGNSGTAASYDIRYSTSNITEGNWVSSTPVSGEPAPLIAGTAQSMIVSGLLDSTSYYFALKTSDAVGNVSGLSNVPNLSTSVPLLPTVSISANPTTITLGQFFNILWSSSNVTLCNASGDWIGSKATTGTESITPISVGTKNYVLACSGSNGTASSSAAVTVNNATLPTASADLSITKTSSPNPVTAGNSLTYTLTVANSGPDDASNVVVSDTLPSALTSTTISSSQGSCSAFPCNLGTIANGNSASITVTASVDSGTTGTITNIASVSSDADDPVSSNNTSTQNTTVSTPTPTPTPTSTGGGAATGTVSPTTVKFSGKAFPGASVLIVDKDIHTEGVVSQDSVVNKDGSFSASFSGIFQSQHSFGLVIKDKDGRTTQTKFFNIDTVSNSLTQKDIFVSPTVGLPERTITRGSNVTVVGFATPKNIVSVEIDDKIKKEVNAGNDGSYKVAMETGALEFGTHSIRVKQIDPTQKRESDYSPTNTFIVSNLTSPKTDLNGDGSVNIKDWSMFLSRWNSKDESQKKALDLNGDGKVDILDFSMFIRTVKK